MDAATENDGAMLISIIKETQVIRAEIQTQIDALTVLKASAISKENEARKALATFIGGW